MRFGPAGAVGGLFERRKRRIPEKARRARAASATRTPAFRGAFTGVPLVIAAGPDAWDSANAMSFADWNLFPRSFSRQCWTIWSRAGGMFRPDAESSGGSSFRIADIVSAGVPLLNAFLPDRSS